MPRPALNCPRCGSPVGNHDWCLTCGAPARTRIVRSPDWRRPVAALAALTAVSLAALAVAFVQLTDDPDPPKLVPQITTTTTPVVTETAP